MMWRVLERFSLTQDHSSGQTAHTGHGVGLKGYL